MKKTFAKVTAIAMAACLTLGLAACGGGKKNNNNEGGDNNNEGVVDDKWTMERVYALAKEKGFEGTLEELIAQLKGDKGDAGKSAYELWLEQGYQGDIDEFFLWLQGKRISEKLPANNFEKAWKAAFDAKNFENFKMQMEIKEMTTLYEVRSINNITSIRAGKLAYEVDWCNDGWGRDKEYEYYYDSDSEMYYEEDYGYGWETTSDIYEENLYLDVLPNYTTFCIEHTKDVEYVKEEGSYVLTMIQGEEGEDEYEYDKFNIYFEDGKLSTLKCTSTDGYEIYEVTIDFTFGGQTLTLPKVDERPMLTIWVPYDQMTATTRLMNEFQSENPDLAFRFNIQAVSAGEAYSNMAVDPEAGADVFAFMVDQTANLSRIGALSKVSATDVQDLKTRMGDFVDFAKMGNDYYGYPYSADNGFFMFYDSSVISAQDAANLNTVLEKCREQNKEFIIPATNSWYTLSFAYGMGAHVNYTYEGGNATAIDTNLDAMGPDGEHTYAEYCGQQWIDLHQNWTGTFKDFSQEEVGIYAEQAIAEGTFGAAITGLWNADMISRELGSHYAAVRLPDWTSSIDNQTYPWASFAGGKCFGVNGHSKNLEIAHRIAAFLASDEAQTARFQESGTVPASKNVAKRADVQANKAVAALLDQLSYSSVLDLPKHQSYWVTIESFAYACKTGSIYDLAAYCENLVAQLREPFDPETT